MPLEQQISYTGACIALAACLNWASTGRHLLGRPLEMRIAPLWVAMRWTGLCVFATCFLLGIDGTPRFSWVALASSLLLLLGTARTRLGPKPALLGPGSLSQGQRSSRMA